LLTVMVYLTAIRVEAKTQMAQFLILNLIVLRVDFLMMVSHLFLV